MRGKIRWARTLDLELPLAYIERDLVQSTAVFATRHASGGDFSLSRGAGGTRVVIVLAEQAKAPVGLRLVQRYRFTYVHYYHTHDTCKISCRAVSNGDLRGFCSR